MFIYTLSMETSSQMVTYDDCVLAYYSELLEEKSDPEPLTCIELFSVSEAASRMYLREGANEDEVKAQSNRLSHPFGRLCMSGLLDIDSYWEWALAKERPYAEAQVEKTLAQKRYTAASNR